MNRSLKIIIALSLIAVTNMYVDCRKNGYYPSTPQHYFSEPVAIAPYSLTYSVGDTVWLHVSIPGKQLYDTITHQTARYDSANFGVNASVQLLYNNPFVTDGTPFASFAYTQGVTATESTNQILTSSLIIFGCNQSTDYDLQVGIIFKQKGVYGISLSGTLQKCYSSLYTYNQIGFYYTVSDTHSGYYAQLPFGDINQQENLFTLGALTAKTMVCVEVQ